MTVKFDEDGNRVYEKALKQPGKPDLGPGGGKTKDKTKAKTKAKAVKRVYTKVKKKPKPKPKPKPTTTPPPEPVEKEPIKPIKRKRGRPKAPPTARQMLLEIMPVQDMFDKEELKIYNSLVTLYLKDFGDEELTSSDMDDLIVLATNKITEIRLLKSSKDAEGHLDYSTALEKLRNQSLKVKASLSNRRSDRVDTKASGFSIIDLAAKFDADAKAKFEKKARRMTKEQDAMLEELEKYGNKNDVDVKT